MLRNSGHSLKPSICREDSLQKTDGEVQPEGENGTGDLNPPLTAAQTCGWLPQLLRGLA